MGSTYCKAQNKNFVIDNGMVLWKNIYEDSASVAKLKTNPRLDFKTDSTGFIKKTNFNNKKLRELVGEFKIETKKNKYRVIVFNVRFYAEPVNVYGGGIGMQTKTEFSIEESLIKKNGTIRESYFGYNLTETLNPHLVELFTIKDQIKSDW